MIRLSEHISPEVFSSSLSKFTAADYCVEQPLGFPNSPYDYLTECSNRNEEHFHMYAEILLEDAVSKGCDRALISSHLDDIQGMMCAFEFNVADDSTEYINIERDGTRLKLRLPEKYSYQNGGIYAFTGKTLIEICPHLLLPIAIYRDKRKKAGQGQSPSSQMTPRIRFLAL